MEGRQLPLILSEMLRVTILSDSSPKCRLLFWTFVDKTFWTFIAMYGIESVPKTFFLGVEKLKKDYFYCEFIFTFQPDGCAEPTRALTCFIRLVISHCSDNIRLMLPSYTRGVFISSFINSFCWWVGLRCIRGSEEIYVYNKRKSQEIVGSLLIAAQDNGIITKYIKQKLITEWQV